MIQKPPRSSHASSHALKAQILKAATKASIEAGKVLLHFARRTFHVSEKEGAGLVTSADFAAQDKAVKILRKAFPDFGFLTEEAAPEESNSPGRWIIDPLDGTTNFVHGFPMYCVSIAAEWDGEILVGVIYHPILKEIYTAVRGKGAFLNGKRMHVSHTTQLRNSLLTTGFSYHRRESLKAEMKPFERLSGMVRAVRRPGSAALDLAYTARGVFDGFWERNLSPWDVAAGILLVREAGGSVTDFKGTPFNLEGQELLASNSHLHPALLQELSAESQS